MIEITKEEAESLVDLIECNLYEIIRNDVDNDEDVDNLEWAMDIMSVYKKCKEGCAE